MHILLFLAHSITADNAGLNKKLTEHLFYVSFGILPFETINLPKYIHLSMEEKQIKKK